MKKFILASAILVTAFTSCKKEEVKNKNPNCGIISNAISQPVYFPNPVYSYDFTVTYYNGTVESIHKSSSTSQLYKYSDGQEYCK